VSEFERVSLDDVYKMSAIHFLNDLAYLKAKNAHEDYLNKKARGAKIS
jgi:hypothetical protein